MCVCSEIKRACAEGSSPNDELDRQVVAFLTLLHGFLSTNKQLPFMLRKRTEKPSETETRIARIYDYDPTAYNTSTLLTLKFREWNVEPSSFFVWQQTQPGYGTLDSRYWVFVDALKLQQSNAHSCILRRFHCIAIHRLRRHGPQRDDAESIARALFPVLNPSCSPEEDTALKGLISEIETLIAAGPRYENLVRQLGIGSLFLLGDSIPSTVWEKWLPQSGPLFEAAMKHLKSKEIVTLGEHYQQLGERILSAYQSILPFSPCVWIDQAGPPQTKYRKPRRSKAKTQPSNPRGSRRRKNAGSGGVSAAPETHSQADVFQGYGIVTDLNAHADHPDAIRVLLSAAEHSASVPTHQTRSNESLCSQCGMPHCTCVTLPPGARSLPPYSQGITGLGSQLRFPYGSAEWGNERQALNSGVNFHNDGYEGLGVNFHGDGYEGLGVDFYDNTYEGLGLE